MSRRALAIVPVLTAVLTGCGGEAADLVTVARTGDLPAAELTLRVNDGGFAFCNGAEDGRRIPDQDLLEVRAAVTDLEEVAAEGLRLAPGPKSLLRYEAEMPEGTVAFADTSRRQPKATYELAALTRRIAKGTCGLPR